MNKAVSASDFLDPGLLQANPALDQQRAATPSRHVWVRASAGSGKTKVLVDRLLRLLLPDPDTGAPGIAPDKILCLTFTKAGAAEMSLRLQKRLLEWSALEEDALKEKIAGLLGHEASPSLITEARKLFARVLDAPSKLKILTIHAFCQTVLGRFPVETGLSPDFKIIEEAETSEYLDKALTDNLVYAGAHPDSDTGQVFSRLALVKNQADLQSDIRSLINEPIKLAEFLQDTDSLKSVQNKLAGAFGIGDLSLVTEAGFCHDDSVPRNSLQMIAQYFLASSPGDKARGQIVLDWLSADHSERLAKLPAFKKAISDKPGGKAAKDNPDLLERLEKEKERLDRCNLAKNILATADLMFLGSRILKAFDRHKKFMGVMDYNDLIFNTRRLLSGEFWKDGEDEANKQLSTSWVLYKLDEGIDHILVDESQDTNPDQWKIIELLTEEYFAGDARHFDRTRTLFVVGDEKQSIFSFQRADPAVFFDMRRFFAEKAASNQEGFEESLIFSFRSTAPVLKLTDKVFENPELLQHIGMQGDRLRHISYRSDNKRPQELYGSVELWQPFIDEKKTSVTSGWELPLDTASEEENAQQRLARKIAIYAKGKIDKGEARPQDIMILMRTRSPLMLQIIRALKDLSLPVSGLDRIVLGDSLIVQDILAICDFVLLPEDSFSLACLLKSPFTGISEEQLMDLSLSRKSGQTLWSALRDNNDYAAISAWLSDLVIFSRTVQPYEFIDRLLTFPCPADSEGSGYRACQRRLGEDVLEPLDEILAQSLKLELQEIRTLQEFVAYQRHTRREIKREMEEAAGQIRIMTVHASKGLEAPIVILPDTMSVPRASQLDKFLWPDKSRLAAPLWSDSSETRSKTYQTALSLVSALQTEESSRLLYVAMTRAKEDLVICGAGKLSDNSWYTHIAAGFDRLDNVVTGTSGDKFYAITAERPKTPEATRADTVSLPEWIYRPVPPEGETPGAFTPSAQGAGEQPVYSPHDQANEFRFRRGIATHKLLQILPDLAADRQESAARRFISSQNFTPGLQDSIVTETMKILRDPVFAPVFGPDSLAEVPVTGELAGGRLINGQIDRLIVTGTEILIVDYKTNRPSPRNSADIPPAYKAQMKAYAEALARIYPDHTVKCALLWTDQPLLMPVSI